MNSRPWHAWVLVALIVTGCYKTREPDSIKELCIVRTPDYSLYLEASTDTVEFRGEISEATVVFTLTAKRVDDQQTVDLLNFQEDATLMTFDPRGDGKALLPVTGPTFSYVITQPGIYRPSVAAVTCRQSAIVARTSVVARKSFAPILTVETIPDIGLGVDVGQQILVVFTVADRDGSKVFDLTFDPDGTAGPMEPVHKSSWDTSIEPQFQTQYSYSNPGLVEFQAVIVDEQEDASQYYQNAAVGLVGIFDGLIQNTVNPMNIRALDGYSDKASETVWAIAAGSGGLRMYAYDPDDGAVHVRGQLAGSGPGAVPVEDLLYDPVSRLGWISVSTDGLYSVDLTDLGAAKYRPPYDRHYPVYAPNVQRKYGIVQRLADAGSGFGLVANGGPGEFHLLRWNSVELDSQRDSGLAFDENALCQITDGKLNGIRQCDCPNADDSCARSRYADLLNVGQIQDVAWLPPYLALVGDSNVVRILNASNAVTGPRSLSSSYSIAPHSTFLVPAIQSSMETNYGTSITGEYSSSSTITWYVAHNDHGLAFGKTDLTAGTSELWDEPYSNFHAERRAGLIGQTSVAYDAFRSVRVMGDQLVVADQFGETRSALLALNPETWMQRDPDWGVFYYEYSQKCQEIDLWGDAGKGNHPITYVTDCIPMVAERLDVAGNYVGVVGGNRFYLAEIADAPTTYTYYPPPLPPAEDVILADGSTVASMYLSGAIVGLKSIASRLFVARSVGGLEVWDLSETNSEQQLLPRVVDGVGGTYSVEQIWPSSVNGVWVSDLNTVQYWASDVNGRFSASAVTEVVLPNTYSMIHLNVDSDRIYGLDFGDGTIDASDLGGTVQASTVNAGYSAMEISETGQLIAQRFTTNGAIVFEWLSPGLSVESVLQQPANVSFQFLARSSDWMYVLETRYDGTVDANTLKVYERAGTVVRLRHSLDIPSGSSYISSGVQMKMVGTYLAVLFKGTNRGVYLFDVADPSLEPEFVASALRADLGLMDMFLPMQLNGNLAVVGAANGGFHAGKLDFVRFLFNP